MKTKTQEINLAHRQEVYANKVRPAKKLKNYQIVLKVLADSPDTWFATWELMGDTKYGFLSHATHAVLRKLEQQGLIIKDYVGQYVVYSHNHNREDSHWINSN